MERLMDRAARELAIDPAEIRRRNLIQPEQMPYPVGLTFRDGKPVVYDSGDYPAAFETALSMSAYRGFSAAPKGGARTEALHRYRRRFLCRRNGPRAVRRRHRARAGRRQNCRVLRARAARAGHKTMLQQIVAEQLGVAMDDIVVTLGDTARSRWAWALSQAALRRMRVHPR
jgi:CO/xanthine dehydrogenase Mo-binding subunit